MQAIIEIQEGETPYKIIRSGWLKDSQGPVLFKLLSKKRADGLIEAAYVVERNNGYKTVIATTETEEDKFMEAANGFRQMVWQFFPDADLAVEDVAPIATDRPHSTSQYMAVRNNVLGEAKIKMKKWFA